MSIATARRWTQSMGMQGLQAVGAISVYGWRVAERTGQCINVIMIVFCKALGWLHPKLANKLELGWFQMIAIFHAWRIVCLDEKNKILKEQLATSFAEKESLTNKNNALTSKNAELQKKISILSIELDAARALLQPIQTQLQSVLAQNEILRKENTPPTETWQSILKPEQLQWIANLTGSRP